MIIMYMESLNAEITPIILFLTSSSQALKHNCVSVLQTFWLNVQ